MPYKDKDYAKQYDKERSKEPKRAEDLKQADIKRSKSPKRKEWQKEYRKRTYDPIKRKEANDKYLIEYKYGITREEYNNILEKQNDCCCICGTNKSEFTRRLAVDHDHVTGAVRGLLCSKCNILLGQAKDDITVLENMIEYLKRALV